MRDALGDPTATDIATVAVVTEQFVTLATILAEDSFRPGLHLHVLPYPLDTRPEAAVRQIARDSFAGLLTKLGAQAGDAAA